MSSQLFRSSVCGEGICKLAPRCWRALAAPLEHPTPPSPSNLPSSDHLDKLFVETLSPLALLVVAQLVAWARMYPGGAPPTAAAVASLPHDPPLAVPAPDALSIESDARWPTRSASLASN